MHKIINTKTLFYFILLNWIELNWIESNWIQTGQCFFQSLCQNALSWVLILMGHLIKHFKAKIEFYVNNINKNKNNPE